MKLEFGAKEKEEVRSGFRLVGKLLFGFFVLGLLVMGADALSGGSGGRLGKPGACFGLLLGMILLYLTADGWRKWIAGVFFYGVLRAAIAVLTGTMNNPPYKPIWRGDIAVAIFYFAVAGGLTMTFASTRKPLNPMAKVLLSAAIPASLVGAIENERGYWWLATSLVFLSLAKYQHRPNRRHQTN